MRRHGLRNLLVFAAFGLLAFSGLGALAQSVARAEVQDLRVGTPLQGDRFAYGAPDGELVRAYRWNGTRHAHDEWGHPIHVDLLEVSTPEGDERYGFLGGADQSIFVEGGGASAAAEGGERGDAFLHGSNASTIRTASVAIYPGERPVQADLPCLERGGWQGRTLAEIAASSFEKLCPSNQGVLGLEPREVQDFGGLVSQRFLLASHGQPHKAFWLAPGVPYPLGVAECQGVEAPTCDDPSDATLVLLGYEPGGGGDLLPPVPPPPEAPAERLDLRPLHRGAPAGGPAEFTLAQALDAIEQDKELTIHREWMRQNPDALLTRVVYHRDPTDPAAEDPVETWDFTWSNAEGQESWVRSEEDADCRLMPPLPPSAPPGTSFPCRPGNREEPIRACECLPATKAPDRVLSASQAVRLFEARRLSQEPFWGYWYDLRGLGGGEVEATILVMAAAYEPAPRQPDGPLPPLFGAPGANGINNGDSVLFDGLTGRVIYHSYVAERTVTWSNRSGLLGELLHAHEAPSYGVQTQDLKLAGFAVPDRISATSAVLAVAALLGALAGARVFASLVLLYTRLSKKDVAAHPRRAAILQALERTPGLSLQELEEATLVKGGALQHHVRVLVRSGHLARLESGGYARHFLAGSGDHARFAQEAILLGGGIQARLLARLREQPGTHAAQLARDLGVSRAAVHYTLQRLARHGLVSTRRQGRRRLLFVQESAD